MTLQISSPHMTEVDKFIEGKTLIIQSQKSQHQIDI